MQRQRELIPHLFRTEFSKIAAVLCRHLGVDHIAIAEDIASETFLSALETWTYKGIPENPTAWLYAVARNKARNHIIRNRVFSGKITDELKHTSSRSEEMEVDLSDRNITDSQLQMLFALCHPSIPAESQIGLSLRILCGFGIDEIANAFLTNKEVINKRLFRAREKLRLEKVRIEFPGDTEINSRLKTVLTTLYLLFSEGYYSESGDSVLREDLCLEAMRLTYLLIENEPTDLPEVNALFSLMCFHSSRFAARKGEQGAMILYQDQDETLWDVELISRGGYYLNKASRGNTVSTYHLQAGIAYWQTIKTDSEEKWSGILQLHNHLLMVDYSPIAALNRTYALSRVVGKQEAIAEAERLNLTANHFYYTLLGELYKGIDDGKARLNFEKAYSLAKTRIDKETIHRKLKEIGGAGSR